ncbi:hypothetical protein M8C21_020817, partial [Ambrosia artemisiifolia]
MVYYKTKEARMASINIRNLQVLYTVNENLQAVAFWKCINTSEGNEDADDP